MGEFSWWVYPSLYNSEQYSVLSWAETPLRHCWDWKCSSKMKSSIIKIASFLTLAVKIISFSSQLGRWKSEHKFSSRTQMLTVNVMINVIIIGQPRVTAIFRWRARLAYESTVTVMDPISGTTLVSTKVTFKACNVFWTGLYISLKKYTNCQQKGVKKSVHMVYVWPP